MHKIAILSGNGNLPLALAAALQAKQQPYMMLGFHGFTREPQLAGQQEVAWAHLGQLGRAVRLLKKHGVSHVVLAGGIARPALHKLRLDWLGLKTLYRLLKKQRLGDNALLTTLLSVLEENGLSIAAAHEIAPDLLLQPGAVGQTKPTAKQMTDLDYARQVADSLGQHDIGQAVVVQKGRILGVEGVEGTKGLLERLAPWTTKQPGAILLKTAKLGQDTRVDLPTFGLETVEDCIRLGYAGLAGQSESTLLLNAEDCRAAADKAGLFIYGC